MKRDYDKEIEEARKKVNDLIVEKQAAVVENLPDIKGKFFKAAWRTFYKVINVVDANDDDEIYCDVFYIRIDEESAQIMSFNGYCEIDPRNEITEGEFMKWYNDAQKIISESLINTKNQ